MFCPVHVLMQISSEKRKNKWTLAGLWGAVNTPVSANILSVSIICSLSTKVCQKINSTLSAADWAGGGVSSSSHQLSVELFSSGASEPQCGTETLHHSHQRLSVALHTRQTLETDGLPLRERLSGRRYYFVFTMYTYRSTLSCVCWLSTCQIITV